MRNAFNLVSRQTLLDKCATPAIGQLMQQAQLALCYAGFGLRSLSHHSCAAFITSVCSSGFGDRDNQYLAQAIALFNWFEDQELNHAIPLYCINKVKYE